MAPTILIIGATGNTGRSCVSTLSKLLQTSPTFYSYRILALTRSLHSPPAQKLAQLPKVQVAEQNWVEITPTWLLEHEITRAFTPYAQTNQFTEESTFHLAALRAGVKYVVRISTTAANIRPDCAAYYPQFQDLRWTSSQPNVFSTQYLYPVAEFIKQYRKTGKKDTLRLAAARDAPAAIIDPQDIGILAAHLLSQEDISVHNRAKYVLNGPEDISEKQIVEMVEQYTGAKVENVIYEDMSYIDYLAATTMESKNVVLSIKHALETSWDGKCTVSTTSKEILEIAAPKHTPADVLKSLLGQGNVDFSD